MAGARRNPIVPAKATVQTTIPVYANRLTVVLVEKIARIEATIDRVIP